MGTLFRFPPVRIGWSGLIIPYNFIRVTILVMPVGTIDHLLIAIVCVLMTAGCSCYSFRVTTFIIMFRMMFAQAACIFFHNGILTVRRKNGCGHQRHHHAAYQQGTEHSVQSLFHIPSSLSSLSDVWPFFLPPTDTDDRHHHTGCKRGDANGHIQICSVSQQNRAVAFCHRRYPRFLYVPKQNSYSG